MSVTCVLIIEIRLINVCIFFQIALGFNVIHDDNDLLPSKFTTKVSEILIYSYCVNKLFYSTFTCVRLYV